MSGFGGIIRLDGRPLDPRRLPAMGDALAYRAWDGAAQWCSGNVGVVHTCFWTTPEEEGEIQPRFSPSGRHWIVSDARIDNRSELIPLLRGHLAAGTPTDADLILAAYEEWGEGCPDRLIGDFAFAVGDSSGSRLFLARDPCSIRHLYYSEGEGEFLFGSTAGAVLAAKPGPLVLHRAVMEEMLRNYYRLLVEHTFYRDVQRLLPGHSLTVTARGGRPAYRANRVLYDPHAFADLRRPEDWIEEFRRRLDLAVTCRLRSRTPVVIRCGGGVDSSALSCTAHRLTQSLPAAPPVCLSASVSSHPDADERAYFDLVERYCPRFETLRVDTDRLPDAIGLGASDYPVDAPEIDLGRERALTVMRQAVPEGSRVVMMGLGANEVLGHNLYALPQALRGVALKHLRREAGYHRTLAGRSWRAILYHAYLRPMLPPGLVERSRKYRPGQEEWPSWVNRTVAGAPMNFLGREYLHPPGMTPAGRVIYGRILSGFHMARSAIGDVRMLYLGYDRRVPFYDRRLVELMLSAPIELLSWEGKDRILLRRAMEGRMPPEICSRRDKAYLGGIMRQTVWGGAWSYIEQLLNGMRLEALGMVDSSRLREAVETCRGGNYRMWNRIVPALCLEAWVRSLPESVRVSA